MFPNIGQQDRPNFGQPLSNLVEFVPNLGCPSFGARRDRGGELVGMRGEQLSGSFVLPLRQICSLQGRARGNVLRSSCDVNAMQRPVMAERTKLPESSRTRVPKAARGDPGVFRSGPEVADVLLHEHIVEEEEATEKLGRPHEDPL